MDVLLTHSSPARATSAAERELGAVAEAARQSGWRVVGLDPGAVISPELLPDLSGSRVMLSGYVSAPGYLDGLDRAAIAGGFELFNSAAASREAMEFSRWYPKLSALTPRSVVLETPADCAAAARELGFPLFIKGNVKSDKELGWEHCIADAREDLERALAEAKRRPIARGGVVVARRLATLRVSGQNAHGFPRSREYRVFCHRGQVIGEGYYWGGPDPFGPLSGEDLIEVRALALSAARRLTAGLLCIDVAELTGGGWTVIEVGDPQFSGITQIPAVSFFGHLSRVSRADVEADPRSSSLK